MPFPSTPTSGQVHTTSNGTQFRWNAGGFWEAVGGGVSGGGGSSGGLTFPTWTTATRPASPAAGDSGWNTDTGSIEVWNGSAWTDVGGSASVPTWTTATRPAGATAGTLGLNTDLGFLEVYDGANWDRVGNSSFFSGPTQPTNMIEGDEWLDTSVTPAVLKKYVDEGSGASWTDVDQIGVPQTFAGTATPTGGDLGFTAGTAANVSLSTSGGTGPYTYSVASGALPTGLTLSGSTISGTPTSSGAYSFVIRATDSTGAVFDTTYSGTIAATFAGTATPAGGDLGLSTLSAANITLSTTGGTSPYTYSVSAGALPGGLTLSGNTISGTPTTAGAYSFTIRATDANGATFDTVYSGDVTSVVSWSSLANEYVRLQASDAAENDWFGQSVSFSSDGNTLAVGVGFDDNSGGTDAGSVYVFTRSGSTWTEQTRLQASDAATSDQFGRSVSLSSDGNTLAVGASYDGANTGSVYIFTRSGSTWTEQTRLEASDAAANDFFGIAVSLSSDGNTLAVGARGDDNSGGTDAGSVYVFTRSGSTWTEQTRLQASDAAANDNFGQSVSLSFDGTTLAVGALHDDNSGGTDVGSVYVFTRSGSTWAEQTRLQASDAAANDRFGFSVSLSSDGNTLAVGAYVDDNSGGTDAGSVYIFVRSGSTWTEQTRLQASDAATSDLFGESVSLSSDGNTLAVGASYGGANTGSVYIFTFDGSTWTEQTRLEASDAAADDRFGVSVSLSSDGNTLAVGADRDDNSGGSNAGSVYMFGSTVALSTFAGTVTPSSLTITEGEAFTATFTTTGGTSPYTYVVQSGTLPAGLTLSGATLSGTPTDVAGTAYFFMLRVTDSTGAVYDAMFSGSVAAFTVDWSSLANEYVRLQASDAAADDKFGHSVSLSSDGNTLAVGAALDDNSGGSDAGSVYVFTRSGSTWAEQTRLQASDAAGGDSFGERTSLSSDGNTLVVGAFRDANSGGSFAGSVYVFTRSGSNWTEQTRLQASDAAANDTFGYSVALSSDGNTLAVGASSDDNSGGTNAGSVYVFTFDGTNWTEQTRLQASDAAASDSFGTSVSLSSDGNTLAVGASSDDNSGGTNAGSVYVFTFDGTNWTEQTRLEASDAAANDYFGSSVSLSSDGNTLAVGARGDDNSGGTDAGSVYVFAFDGTNWTEQTRLQASDAAANDYFGSSVSLSSDGNTLAVGAFADDNSGGENAGSVYVFTLSGSTWTEQTRLQASDAALRDRFGYSVSLSSDGNTLAVGAHEDDNSGGTNAGSVYMFGT